MTRLWLRHEFQDKTAGNKGEKSLDEGTETQG